MYMTIPKFSLILATYGRSDDVGRLVNSLVRQSLQDFELIVVDQNEDDRLLPYLETARDGGIEVNHLRMVIPNLSAARNMGLAAARCEWIAFPDDDCWYEPDALAQVQMQLRGDLGGLVIHWVEFHATLNRQVQKPVLSLRDWLSFRGGDASSITLFMRTALVRELNGYDDRLGVGQYFGSGEETDLIIRALQKGARIERLAAARVHHLYAAVSKAQFSIQYRHILSRARGTGAIYAKHKIAFWVILRGLFAPALRALLVFPNFQRSALLVAVVRGRMQGWLGWKD